MRPAEAEIEIETEIEIEIETETAIETSVWFPDCHESCRNKKFWMKAIDLCMSSYTRSQGDKSISPKWSVPGVKRRYVVMFICLIKLKGFAIASLGLYKIGNYYIFYLILRRDN